MRIIPRIESLHTFYDIALALLILVYFDFFFAIFGSGISIVQYCVAFGILLFLVVFLGRNDRIRAWYHILLNTLLMIALLFIISWGVFSKGAVYNSILDQNDYGGIFTGKTVMCIVAHQDDELNLVGGVLEKYISCGSDVYIVFTTSGDKANIGEKTNQEAIDQLTHNGILEKNIIFLGYSDTWSWDTPHIYNAHDVELESFSGRRTVFATEQHQPYHINQTFKAENFVSDIKNVILEIEPDVIFCCDYDGHIDHRATSLAFEKAMGEILRNGKYRPVVMKGYAYSTAWKSEDDFFELNIRSTTNSANSKDLNVKNVMQVIENYEWDERVRLPVKASTLSRSLLSTNEYRSFDFYKTQKAVYHASRVVNGDKVFWERPTTSILYEADVEASSGNIELLNDFMILECGDLVSNGDSPFDGTWIPDQSDKDRWVKVTLDKPMNIDYINLYDNPSEKDNILDASIQFDCGEVISTGPLERNGQATRIPIGLTNVCSFLIRVHDTEGANAGIAEVEAFCGNEKNNWEYAKIVDKNNDFTYDFVIEDAKTNKAFFSLYTPTEVDELSEENYSLVCSNEKCKATISNGGIEVLCPRYLIAEIILKDKNGERVDSIVVSNPGMIWRNYYSFFRRMVRCQQKSVTIKIVRQVFNRFEIFI